MRRLETILALTRDLGVNLAGVEVILNMREEMARMQIEVDRLLDHVRREMVDKKLGISRQTLRTKLKEFALDDVSDDEAEVEDPR